MKENLNHIEALDGAFLVDRKHGHTYILEHVSRGVFIANNARSNEQSMIALRKIASGLKIRRYRILEAKN